MSEETLLKFSAELKTHRESKGISLVQISNRTKIDLKFLSAIEEGKFDVLPEIYMRAFIKEYSQVIELNPSITLSNYDIAKSGKTAATQNPPVQEIKKTIEVKPEQTKVDEVETITPQVTINTDTKIPKNDSKDNETKEVGSTAKQSKVQFNYVISGIVLVVAVVIFYFAFIQNSSEIITYDNNSVAKERNNQPRYEVNQSANPIERDSTEGDATSWQTTQAVNPIKSDSLRLQVQITSRVWVKIYSDGKVMYQQMVEGGTKLNFSAKNKFAVSVGDAGAVKILYNNKPIPNIGKTGESRNITIAPEGFKYYTISNEKKSSTTN